MLKKILLYLRKHIMHIDDRSQLEIAIENGLQMGKNCHVMGECIIDPGHCWLITIGDRVTLAPRVHILAHDASTKRILGYTLIGKVTIGNDVFIGAGSIILPNVTIGNNVIIGAGSVVTHSIPDNLVVAGNPAKVITTYQDYQRKRENQLANTAVFDESFTIHQISEEKKELMKEKLTTSIGFVR
jgi:maltose O-acetyltransferase